MKTILRPATADQMEWINAKYEAINFAPSNYANEWIVIAEVQGKKAGLGRLVKIDATNIELGGIYVSPEFRGQGIAEKIVATLLQKNPFSQSTIWCLPFNHLQNFYLKFGFAKNTHQEVPTKVLEKLNWCNAENRYEKEVVSLCKLNSKFL